MAHKIDFGEEKEIEEEKEEDEESTENKTDQFKPKKWPWDSVRNKIRYFDNIKKIIRFPD